MYFGDETKEALNKGAKIFSKAIIIPFAIFLVIVGLIMFLAFKDSSKTDDYEVSINYDEDGYVNEIKADKIKK